MGELGRDGGFLRLMVDQEEATTDFQILKARAVKLLRALDFGERGWAFLSDKPADVDEDDLALACKACGFVGPRDVDGRLCFAHNERLLDAAKQDDGSSTGTSASSQLLPDDQGLSPPWWQRDRERKALKHKKKTRKQQAGGKDHTL